MTLCPEPGQASGRQGSRWRALCINRWRGRLCLARLFTLRAAVGSSAVWLMQS